MNVKRLTVRDSRGHESKILFITLVSWVVLLIKYIAGGMVLPFDLGTVPVTGAGEFGTATAALAAVIAARKWINATANSPPGEQPAE